MKRTRLKRKTAFKKKRKTQADWTLNDWKKEFWKHFSKFIRTRDDFTCFTCGKTGNGKGMHAGHFIPKAAGGLSLYFHEKNVHAQCYYCNINLGGNGAEYYRRMVDKYSKKKVEELFKLRDQGILKYTIEDYKKLIQKYKKKLKKLEDDKRNLQN